MSVRENVLHVFFMTFSNARLLNGCRITVGMCNDMLESESFISNMVYFNERLELGSNFKKDVLTIALMKGEIVIDVQEIPISFLDPIVIQCCDIFFSYYGIKTECKIVFCYYCCARKTNNYILCKKKIKN